MYTAENTFIYGKRQQKKKKSSYKFTFFIILLFLIFAFILFLISPFSKIDLIEVSGNSLLTEEEIHENADIYYGMNYFLARKSKIEDKLLELEEVKEVEVVKIFPGKLLIDIIELKPVAYLYKDTDWVLILENGLLYYKLENNEFLEYPLITSWQDMSQINKLAEELNNIKPSILAEISEIKQDSQENRSNQLLVFTREGYRIHLLLDDFSGRFNLYSEIVENIKIKNINIGDIYLFDSIRFEEYNITE